MRPFTDVRGDKWDLALTIGDIARVKAELSIDLLEPGLTRDGQVPGEKGDPPPLAALLRSDFLLFYDVLRVLLEPEAEARGVDPREFGRRLSGDSLHQAHEAFFAEWESFFRQLGLEHLATVIQAHGTLMAKVLALAKKQVEAVNIEAIDIERVMAQATPGSSSGS